MPNYRTPKDRREQIKVGIEFLKQTLPLTGDQRDEISQLQTLHYACIYLRKEIAFANLNMHTYQNRNDNLNYFLNNQLGLSESLFGFIVVLSSDGYLLYVSENVVDYLGLKAFEVLLNCDKFSDILHPSDEEKLNGILNDNNSANNKTYEFFCSWYAAKIKRKIQVSDNSKVIKMTGRFIANNGLFVALCTPMLRTLNRECLTASSPTCFTSVHSLDLKFLEISSSGENLLGFDNSTIRGISLYDLLNVKDLEMIRKRHKTLLSNKSQKGKVDTVQLLMYDGSYVDCLLNMYYSTSGYVICKVQVLNSSEMTEYKKYIQAILKSTTDEKNISSQSFGEPISPFAQHSVFDLNDSDYYSTTHSVSKKRELNDMLDSDDDQSNRGIIKQSVESCKKPRMTAVDAFDQMINFQPIQNYNINENSMIDLNPKQNQQLQLASPPACYYQMQADVSRNYQFHLTSSPIQQQNEMNTIFQDDFLSDIGSFLDDDLLFKPCENNWSNDGFGMNNQSISLSDRTNEDFEDLIAILEAHNNKNSNNDTSYRQQHCLISV